MYEWCIYVLRWCKIMYSGEVHNVRVFRCDWVHAIWWYLVRIVWQLRLWHYGAQMIWIWCEDDDTQMKWWYADEVMMLRWCEGSQMMWGWMDDVRMDGWCEDGWCLWRTTWCHASLFFHSFITISCVCLLIRYASSSVWPALLDLVSLTDYP